jgi:glutamate synthase (NADPH/NADH) small chain
MGEEGRISALEVVSVEWSKDKTGKYEMKEIPGTEEIITADLVLLALGFLHPVHDGLVRQLGLALDVRKNIKVDNDFNTSNPNIFAAGDAKDGASLVVKAIYSGRQAADSINKYLRNA